MQTCTSIMLKFNLNYDDRNNKYKKKQKNVMLAVDPFKIGSGYDH